MPAPSARGSLARKRYEQELLGLLPAGNREAALQPKGAGETAHREFTAAIHRLRDSGKIELIETVLASPGPPVRYASVRCRRPAKRRRPGKRR